MSAPERDDRDEPEESVACSVGEHNYCGSGWCDCRCHPRRYEDDRDRRGDD